MKKGEQEGEREKAKKRKRMTRKWKKRGRLYDCILVLTSINDALSYNGSKLGERVFMFVGYDLGKVLAVECHFRVHCF